MVAENVDKDLRSMNTSTVGHPLGVPNTSTVGHPLGVPFQQ